MRPFMVTVSPSSSPRRPKCAVLIITVDVANVLILSVGQHQVTDTALDLLQQFRRLGIVIAIDDFGSGYSSLARLRHLPVDVLKIDREFINNSTNAEGDKNVVQAITAMARALDLIVVAEGVETVQQARLVQDAGCQLSQGYYYGRPQEASDIEARFASRAP